MTAKRLGGDSITLVPRPPFSFEQTLSFLREFTPMGGEQVEREGSFSKAVMLGGRTYGFRVRATGTSNEPRLECELHAERPIEDAAKEGLRDRIDFFLSLQDDLAGFYARAKGDASFSPILERFYGHKQVKFLTPFENACWAVLTQRVPMTQARRAKENLTRQFGGTVPVDGADLAAFPEPGALLRADDDELARAVQNVRKVEYLRAVAHAFRGVDEPWLRTGPYDEVYAWLRSIRGIGEWSANFVLIRGLGRMERLSGVGDKLANAVGRVYDSAGRPLSEARVREIASRYGIFRGYWAYYLRIDSEFPRGAAPGTPTESWMTI